MTTYIKGLLNTNSNSKQTTMTQKTNEASNKHGLTQSKDAFGHTSFSSNKARNIAPKIIREYDEEDVNQETGESTFKRMYECEPKEEGGEPRIFVASAYDKNFLPQHGNHKVVTNQKRITQREKNSGISYRGGRR